MNTKMVVGGEVYVILDNLLGHLDVVIGTIHSVETYYALSIPFKTVIGVRYETDWVVNFECRIEKFFIRKGRLFIRRSDYTIEYGGFCDGEV